MDSTAQQHFQNASVFFEHQRFRESIEELEKAIELEPDYIDAHFSLGSSLSRVGAQDAAITEFQKVIQLDPMTSKAYEYIAIAQVQKAFSSNTQPDWQAALDAYTKAQALLPRDPGILEGKALTLWHLGETDDALKTMLASVNANPEAMSSVKNLMWMRLRYWGRLAHTGQWKKAWHYTPHVRDSIKRVQDLKKLLQK